MSNLQTNVPLINEPFTDPKTGLVTEAWFIFLIQLFRRTGGTSGSTPASLTLADVLSLEETFAPLTPNLENALAQMATMGPILPPDTDWSNVIYGPIDLSQPSSEMVFPAPVPDILDQTFSSGIDFTGGTTTSLTLQTSFASAARLWIFFDAAFQGDDQYTLSNTTLTFTSAIPFGTNKVYVKGLM